MNTVAFGIFIGLAAILTMWIIQKTLDNPNS
jgi:hypothetical protein